MTLNRDRPARRMPTLHAVVQYHINRHGDALFDVFPNALVSAVEPGCWACGWLTPPWVSDDPLLTSAEAWKLAEKYLDRAHLIDRCFDGLDNASNLIPLCQVCHREQPSFRSGQEENAMNWVRRHEAKDYFFQMMTDARDVGLHRNDIRPLFKKCQEIQRLTAEAAEAGATVDETVKEVSGLLGA